MLAHLPPIGRDMRSEGSQQREVADGAYVVFTDTRCVLYVVDAFVNSQEWTVSRKLRDIRLVISCLFYHSE